MNVALLGNRTHEFQIKRWLLGDPEFQSAAPISSIDSVLASMRTEINSLLEPNRIADDSLESVKQHYQKLSEAIEIVQDMERTLLNEPKGNEVFLSQIVSIREILKPAFSVGSSIQNNLDAEKKQKNLKQLCVFLESIAQKQDLLTSIAIPSDDPSSFENLQKIFNLLPSQIGFWNTHPAVTRLKSQFEKIQNLRTQVQELIQKCQAAIQLDEGKDVDPKITTEYLTWKNDSKHRTPIDWGCFILQQIRKSEHDGTYWRKVAVQLGDDHLQNMAGVEKYLDAEIKNIISLREALKKVNDAPCPAYPTAAFCEACCQANYWETARLLYFWFGLDSLLQNLESADLYEAQDDLEQKLNTGIQNAEQNKPFKEKYNLPQSVDGPPNTVLEWYVSTQQIVDAVTKQTEPKSKSGKALWAELIAKPGGVALHVMVFLQKSRFIRARSRAWLNIWPQFLSAYTKYVNDKIDHDRKWAILRGNSAAQLAQEKTAAARYLDDAFEHAPKNSEVKSKSVSLQVSLPEERKHNCEAEQ